MKTTTKVSRIVSGLIIAAILIAAPIHAQSVKNERYNTENQNVRKKMKVNNIQEHHKRVDKYRYDNNKNKHKSPEVFVVHRQIPPHSKPVTINGVIYYHHQHTFYRPYPKGGFIVVRPPEFIHKLPREAKKVYYNGSYRIYYNGIFFKPTPYGYVML